MQGEGDMRGEGSMRGKMGACVAGWDVHVGETAAKAGGTHPTGMHFCC